MAKRLPPEKEEEIIRLYNEGVPVIEIADRLGVSTSTIYTVLWRRGIRPSRRRGRRTKIITPEEEEEIVREYLSGMPIHAIVSKHGISTTTLYRILKKRGVKLRRHYATLVRHSLWLPRQPEEPGDEDGERPEALQEQTPSAKPERL